ncbi:ribonucleotide reductase [Corynebacterium phage Darwin]|uniref:ribonucleoside-diphosphate reductase n=1 Tax=Corynebacterium phage Darwin TaxID=2047869 RepID=A0A2H4P8K2_9CAUD|nr:ribonucleotide reductase [Corynebacterium phage Darwin]ATW58556.1 ribonucleotide reductase [Corynebacterium phage Darwin]
MIIPIDWNTIEDSIDLEVWNRLTTNFWLPEKVPLSNDLRSWGELTPEEQLATRKVFAGLTLLDTLQGTVGAVSIIPDSRTPHEEAVLTNISFMEAFSGDTELLTPEGWKRIDEVREEDLVAQYDPERNETAFVNPTIIPPHFSEEVYEIASNNGNARQVVSGGHRVYLEEKVKKSNSCKDWTHTVVEARELAGINLNSAHRRFRSAAPAPSGEGMTDTDRLLLAINADGTIRGDRYTGGRVGTIPVSFTLKKERKIERLKKLSESVGWDLTEDIGPESRGTFYLSLPLEFAKDRSKRMSQWWSLEAKSSNWCREFVEESGLWDGHTLKGGEGVTFYTTRKEDSDFFVAAATLAGYRSRTVVRVDERSSTYKDSYVTNVTYQKDTVGGQSMRVREADPQMVYCVQVPSTFLVTRNGESPVISGNCVHARSYSSIFSTLCSTEEINEIFRWAKDDPTLQSKAEIIKECYDIRERTTEAAAYRKAASVMLESFMFYSGFYLPFKLASQGRLTNTADIIRLILRDEGVHGYYLGYKFQQHRRELTEEQRDRLDYWIDTKIRQLYFLEAKFSEDLYDEIGWTENVKTYLRYNANKAMQNLGYDSIFSDSETRVEAAIMSSMTVDANETHDFFSGSGSSYVMAEVEETTDDDWD